MSANKNSSVVYFGESNLGMVRSENQDSFGKFPPDSNDSNRPKGLLFIIADGMGGHIGGKDASQSAVDIISKEYFDYDSKEIPVCLNHAFKTANFRINQSSQGELQYQKKGTTCSALVLENNYAHIAHVGDSRVYRISGGKIEQLTNDHTQVGEMVRKGILSKEEAENHPSKSVLVRALGIESEVEVDIIEKIPLNPEETFILCSDGLAKVDKEEIHQVVSSYTPVDACKELIRIANDRGGHDNVTVQVIKFNGDSRQNFIVDKEPERKSGKKWVKSGVVAILIICLILLGFFFQENIKSFFTADNSNEQKITDNNPAPEKDELEIYLAKADYYMSIEKPDSALIFYNLILADYPMHIAALNGTNRIAGKFIKQGDALINQKNYNEAIIFYRKAVKIRRDDQKLYNLILLCEKEIEKKNNESIKTEKSFTAGTDPEEKIRNVSDEEPVGPVEESGVYSNDFSDWELAHLTQADYNLSGNAITFLNTDKQKKIINTKMMEDVDVQVTLKFGNTGNNRAGVIVGYNKKESGSESYFLFSTDRVGNFVLQKFSDSREKRLLSVQKPEESKSSPVSYNLKIKCLGPWIMIYNNNKLLDSWLGEDFISGKIGLFADVSSYAEFSDFKISTAFENREKN